jgi:hypothetical protein
MKKRTMGLSQSKLRGTVEPSEYKHWRGIGIDIPSSLPVINSKNVTKELIVVMRKYLEIRVLQYNELFSFANSVESCIRR